MTVTRRAMLRGLTATGVAATVAHGLAQRAGTGDGGTSGSLSHGLAKPLEEFGYDQVEVRGELERGQQAQAKSVLLGLDENSLLQPFRQMSDGPNAAANLGKSLGGWYEWLPDFDFHHDDAGFAPASTFGQWTSAMSRLYAGSRANGTGGDAALQERVLRLHGLLRQEI